jgi:hypothetical protein
VVAHLLPIGESPGLLPVTRAFFGVEGGVQVLEMDLWLGLGPSVWSDYATLKRGEEIPCFLLLLFIKHFS